MPDRACHSMPVRTNSPRAEVRTRRSPNRFRTRPRTSSRISTVSGCEVVELMDHPAHFVRVCGCCSSQAVRSQVRSSWDGSVAGDADDIRIISRPGGISIGCSPDFLRFWLWDERRVPRRRPETRGVAMSPSSSCRCTSTAMAMAVVEGQALRDRIARGPLPIPEAVEIAAKVAESLHEAHGKGVVHRDVKPAIIMLAPRGQAKMMDFGLAQLAGAFQLTRTGSLQGTAAGGMSPEQVRGEGAVTMAMRGANSCGRSSWFDLRTCGSEILRRRAKSLAGHAGSCGPRLRTDFATIRTTGISCRGSPAPFPCSRSKVGK